MGTAAPYFKFTHHVLGKEKGNALIGAYRFCIEKGFDEKLTEEALLNSMKKLFKNEISIYSNENKIANEEYVMLDILDEITAYHE